ncbi:class I SAM-dependent methyltransferase [Winogradskyella sp. A2]|uniref:class I SAM-dependent methyltransferase n=1 Tax=Winogradskyella sp. A2 TaxID=3366944 RepID=UPI00398C6F85
MIQFLKRNKKLNKLISILSPKSLETRLQLRAADETCDYIEKNMLLVHSNISRNAVLKTALKHVTIDGQYLEFGVFSGKTINLIAKENPTKKIYGFDSFEGLPESWRDGYLPGHFDRKDSLPKVLKNVNLIKGWFSETLPKFIEENKTNVAFLHIDCDIYSSTVTVLELLKPFIKQDSIIVFDEYFNYPGWKDGEYKAFKEFTDLHKIKYEYITYNRYSEQVALKINQI